MTRRSGPLPSSPGASAGSRRPTAPRSGRVPRRELYDLWADPTENTNLLAPANVNAELLAVAAELDAELDAKLVS
jgi:hypothetical protein